MTRKRGRSSLNFSAPNLTSKETEVRRNGVPIPLREFAILLFFSALVLLSYSNTFDAPFLFDDRPNIVENPHIRLTRISVDELWEAGFEGRSPDRPISKMSFALNYYFHQYDVGGYHLVNILIHIATGLFLYLLLKNTLRLVSHRTGDRFPAWIPILTVLIWLVHPLHTGSVTYIVQRMNSLAAMFYILSLLLYAKARLSQTSVWGTLLFAGCIVVGILALGSKQTAATLPLFIFLYEWYFFQDLSRAWLKRRLLPLAGLLALVVVVSLLYVTINPLEQSGSYEYRDFTLGQRVLTEFRVVIFYLSLLVLPHPSRLTLDRGFALSYSPFNPMTTLLSMAGIAALIGLAIYSAKRQRLVSFGILWFLGNLVIESSVIALEIIFDHRTYLPSMFPVLMVALLIYRYARPKFLAPAFLGVVVVVFSVWTYQRNEDFRDEVTFWTDSVQKSPNKARPHNNLGFALAGQGKTDEAMAHYSEAIRIKPNYAEAHNNKCTLLYGQGRLGEAFTECSAALDIKPEYADAQSNLGMVLAIEGRLEEAMGHYSEAIRIKPDHAAAHNNVGAVLLRQGKLQEAIHRFSEALRLDPKLAKAHFGLGRAFQGQGRLDEVILHLSEAVRINPDYGEAHYYLGNALQEQGKPEEAVPRFLRAIRIKPDYADAHNNLGIVLAGQGKLDEAMRHFSEAVRLNPRTVDYHFNLGNALTLLGRHEEAVNHYSEALEMNPDDEELQQTLNRAKSRVAEREEN